MEQQKEGDWVNLNAEDLDERKSLEMLAITGNVADDGGSCHVGVFEPFTPETLCAYIGHANATYEGGIQLTTAGTAEEPLFASAAGSMGKQCGEVCLWRLGVENSSWGTPVNILLYHISLTHSLPYTSTATVRMQRRFVHFDRAGVGLQYHNLFALFLILR